MLAVLAFSACGGGEASTADATTTAAPETATVAATTAATADGGSDGRVAQDGDTVSVHYTGSLDDGEVFDSSRGGQPLSFVLGSGQLITGFDNAVRGMAVGETVTVRMEPAEAYGERDESLILEFPRSEAPEGLVVGDQVSVSGRPAVVVEITDEIVRIDANHRLAGQALTFEIEVVSIN